jgi:NADPH:quinone reductase-like Zn-dependent oxidoreductase
MGDAVLITAASSAVGLAAIQVTRAAGGVPIAATRTSAKREALLKAGAAHVVATEEEDVVAAVQRITGARGARIIFDPIGGPGFAKLGEAAALGGVMILYGALSGQPAQLPISLLRLAITVRGFTLFEFTAHPAELAASYSPIAQKLAERVFRPIVARTFPFERIADAYRFMASNEQVGKIVVTVP